jgi:hypothetical protein
VDFLTGITIGDAGAGALVFIVVLLLFTGRLVPRSTVDAIIAEKQGQTDMWKEAAQRSEATVIEQVKQINALIENSKTTVHVIESLREAAASTSGADA